MKPETPRDEPTTVSENSEEKGVLDYSAEIETAFEELNEILATIAQENEKITLKSQVHSKRFKELNANPTPGSAAQKQKVGLLIASDMNLCAKRFEEELPRFESAVSTLDEGFTGLIALATKTEEAEERVAQSRKMFEGFLGASDIAISAFAKLRDIVAGMTGLSKDVNRASRRLAQALAGIVQNLQNVRAFAVRALALFDQWLIGES
jgi:hypothetical protein